MKWLAMHPLSKLLCDEFNSNWNKWDLIASSNCCSCFFFPLLLAEHCTLEYVNCVQLILQEELLNSINIDLFVCLFVCLMWGSGTCTPFANYCVMNSIRTETNEIWLCPPIVAVISFLFSYLLWTTYWNS